MSSVDNDLKDRIDELRRKAKNLRTSAQYADRSADRARDLAQARQWERQADFLEIDIAGNAE